MSNEMDKYERRLVEKTDELRKCQMDRGYKSCLPCPSLNDCSLRDEYVNAVYESMNKGEAGGFEF